MNNAVGFRSVISVNGSVTKFQFGSDLRFPGAGNQVIDGLKGMNGHVPLLSEISKEAPAGWAEGEKRGLPAGDRIPSGAVREGSRLKVSTSTAFLTRPTLYRRRRAFHGRFRHRREHFPRRRHRDGNLVLRVTPEVEASAGARGRSPLLTVGAEAIDFAGNAIEKKPFPAGAYTTLETSNAGNVTASNTLWIQCRRVHPAYPYGGSHTLVERHACLVHPDRTEADGPAKRIFESVRPYKGGKRLRKTSLRTFSRWTGAIVASRIRHTLR
jgi:hypothetical protein